MSNFKKSSIFHKSFEIGILIKAIDGILEIIGGILLIFLNPNRLSSLVVLLTQHELSEDPRDVIANFMINLSSKFTISTQYFGVFYLISHGIVKVILIVFLWKRKPWAYPLTIISLILFIIYQIYRYTLYPSSGLIILTIFDILMIILTFVEYKRIKYSLS
ncbi:DUF2127 domain-containing protein [Clostridium sp. 19966]|uniref:DUF2127 domain-containing protein n=1 Tax=Clostridium sp. 19966 TaxID=2768166 RepID=UPI0028DDCE80|nr:DUF2127 domain-containing protein [Clostridium sp. 19966]MDT8717141.1 DUF2127 domain-containing protein [Clostridium sp. 19966]